VLAILIEKVHVEAEPKITFAFSLPAANTCGGKVTVPVSRLRSSLTLDRATFRYGLPQYARSAGKTV